MNFVALDVETANSDHASICQIGIAHFADGQFVKSWDTLVNPNDYFDPININIHGIDEDMVADSPKFDSICSELHEQLLNTVVVTHMPFDQVAMRRVHEKYSLDLPAITWLDTAKVVRRTWKDRSRKGYGLKDISDFLNIQFKHHDAVEDARAAGEVLLHAINESGIPLDDWIVRTSKAITPRSSSYSKDITRDGNIEGDLHGEVVVFTGSLSIVRKVAAEHAASAGCDVGNSVTKDTTMLVVGDQDVRVLKGNEKSSKHRKAELLIEKGQKIQARIGLHESC